MGAQTESERALVALLKRADGDVGDSLHMVSQLVEGSMIIEGDAQAGVADIVLGYDVRPDCSLDEDGFPEDEFDHIHLRLEVRERGETEGDEVSVTIPCDWNEPLADDDDERLSAWFDRVGCLVRAS